MTFNINKDFLTEYKDDMYKGLSAREVLSVVSGAAVAGVVGVTAWRYFGIAPDTAVYIGMPFAAPFVILPNLRFQGYMTVWDLMKEMYFQSFCEELSVDGIVESERYCEELEGLRLFRMDQKEWHGLKKLFHKKEKREDGKLWIPKKAGEPEASTVDPEKGNADCTVTEKTGTAELGESSGTDAAKNIGRTETDIVEDMENETTVKALESTKTPKSTEAVDIAIASMLSRKIPRPGFEPIYKKSEVNENGLSD